MGLCQGVPRRPTFGVLAWAWRPRADLNASFSARTSAATRKPWGGGDGLWKFLGSIIFYQNQLDALKSRRRSGLLEIGQEGPCLWKLGNNVLLRGPEAAAGSTGK